jgi:hypothetical protein
MRVIAAMLAGVLGIGCGTASDPAERAGTSRSGIADERATESSGPQTDRAPARALPDAQARDALVGWWLRHDQSYMMVLDAIADDGSAEARYFNPAPVNVSKAEVWLDDDLIRLRLELTDRHYPGNYYELGYVPDRDTWVGLYHHLGKEETYEVYFVRFEDEPPPEH